MDKVTLDQATCARLNGLDRRLELVDEDGRPFGYFLPTRLYHQFLIAWANAQVTDEELRLASQEEGGRPLAEVWERLGRPSPP